MKKEIDEMTPEDFKMSLKKIEHETFSHLLELIKKRMPAAYNNDPTVYSIVIQLAVRTIYVMSKGGSQTKEELVAHFNKELIKLLNEAEAVEKRMAGKLTIH